MDLAALKAQMRAVWARGDYREVARLLMPAAEALVQAVGIGPGQQVLDVAAGTGNVALAAARRGAAVTASDLTPRMLELGMARAETEGLPVEWIEADAEDLPFADGSFDVVTSAFGAIFAPRPPVVVAEAARVLRSGGLLGLAAWTLDGYMAQMSAVTRRWQPLPADLPDPYTWGDGATVRALLKDRFEQVACLPGTLRWTFASPAEHRALLETSSPSHVSVAAAIGPEAAAAMFGDLETLSAGYTQPDGSIAVDATYLLVTARRR